MSRFMPCFLLILLALFLMPSQGLPEPPRREYTQFDGKITVIDLFERKLSVAPKSGPILNLRLGDGTQYHLDSTGREIEADDFGVGDQVHGAYLTETRKVSGLLLVKKAG